MPGYGSNAFPWLWHMYTSYGQNALSYVLTYVYSTITEAGRQQESYTMCCRVVKRTMATGEGSYCFGGYCVPLPEIHSSMTAGWSRHFMLEYPLLDHGAGMQTVSALT
jgi:hypothetical protein